MDRAKLIFGNAVSDRDYQKACRQKEKFRKKFGDDSGTEYHFAAADNAVLAPIGVKNLVLTDKPGLYNLMATEYVYDNKKSSARIIYSTSSAVIHLIDGPLLVNENQ